MPYFLCSRITLSIPCPGAKASPFCKKPWFFLLEDSMRNWRRQWQPTPVLLPGNSRGRRSLVVCSPRGCEESDTTERRRFHFSLSCTGEGNSNPLQCSCLENPRDGGAWWAAVSGVAQSRTRLKRLSSSSSSSMRHRGLGIRCALWTGALPSKPAQQTDEEVCTRVLAPTHIRAHIYKCSCM